MKKLLCTIAVLSISAPLYALSGSSTHKTSTSSSKMDSESDSDQSNMSTRGNGTTSTDRQFQEDSRKENSQHGETHDQTRFPQDEELNDDVD